jgi:hypothetical protein
MRARGLFLDKGIHEIEYTIFEMGGLPLCIDTFDMISDWLLKRLINSYLSLISFR